MNQNPKFKNLPSQRFYEFFQHLLRTEKTTNKQIAEKLGKYENNPSSLLNGLLQGKFSVTTEMIVRAEAEFGLDPCSLFKSYLNLSTTEGMTVMSEREYYSVSDQGKRIGSIVRDIFARHKTNVKQYAEMRLNFSEQYLHKLLRGEGKFALADIVTICEDHAESLDLFRVKPLPHGHFLTRIKLLEETIDLQRQKIAALERLQRN